MPDQSMMHTHPDRDDWLLLFGRIAIGAIFVESSFGKLMNLQPWVDSLVARGVTTMSWELGVLGAVVEFFGGLAIVLGFKLRWSAALMILFTIIATLIGHRFWEFADALRRTQHVQFFKNLAIIGGFLILMTSRGGRFSIDGWLGRRAKN